MNYERRIASCISKDNVIIGSKQKKYTVVLNSSNDTQNFINDMECINFTKETIPSRMCKSLNTAHDDSIAFNYMLTVDEAELLKKDSRVQLVDLCIPKKISIQGFSTDNSPPKPLFETSSVIAEKKEKNIKIQSLDKFADILNLPDGMHVDIVIADGIADPNNPEYSRNSNGTGGTRLNQINWYNVINYINPAYPSYPYTPYVTNDPYFNLVNNHGSHVMGTAGGNTQGWAKKANLYNINALNPSIMFGSDNVDLFLRAIGTWHQNKPINPIFGNRNPTITNHSYGYSYPLPINAEDIISINYRGTTITPNRSYSGAQCSAVLSGSGVGSINITNNGTNYTNAPRVSFYGGGQARAKAELGNGSVSKITITDGGSGYTKSNPPTVTFSQPSAGGIRATGTIVSNRWLNNSDANVVYVNEGNEFSNIGPTGSGQIYYIELTEAGSGYLTPPTVTFSNPGSGGRVAQATVEIGSNFVKKINILNGGTGYSGEFIDQIPYVILSGGNPTESADIILGPVLNKYVNNGSLINGIFYPSDEYVYDPNTKFLKINYFGNGGNYQSEPIVSFFGGNSRDENGNITGNKPEAYAVLGAGVNSGKVVSIVVTKQGSGYTSVPNVVLTNGGGFSVDELRSYGLVVYEKKKIDPTSVLSTEGSYCIFDIPVRDAVTDNEVSSLIAAGVVVVAAAGNNSYKMDVPTGADYNNYFTYPFYSVVKADPGVLTAFEKQDIYTISYHQGMTPAACPGVICVGAAAIDSPEHKTYFSNTGPRVTVYAPGHHINSTTNTDGLADPRNANYRITKWSGTSMASPQVCGMIACHAQNRRTITNGEARIFVNQNSKPTLNDGSGLYSLEGGTNKYAYLPDILYRSG